jgi:hypothetical protein
VTTNEHDAIQRHLYLEPPNADGVQYKSSLIALLQDARGAAERDIHTGAVQPERRSQSWLAATGYLMLLDQIGTCFKLARRPVSPNTNSFIHAMQHFSPITDPCVHEGLYALRNAFAHDYSLFNPNANNQLRRHAFLLDANDHDPLIEFPAISWGGDYGSTASAMATKVNLRRVGDLVEEVVETLRRAHTASHLEVRLGLPQFMIRYGIFYRP